MSSCIVSAAKTVHGILYLLSMYCTQMHIWKLPWFHHLHLHKNQTQNHSLSQILHYKYSLLSISNLLTLQSGLLFSINRLCYATNWSPHITEITEMVKSMYFQTRSVTFIAEHRTKLMLLSAHIIPDNRMTAHRNWQQLFFPEKLPFFVLFSSWYFSLWLVFAVSIQQGCQLQLKSQIPQDSPSFSGTHSNETCWL